MELQDPSLEEQFEDYGWTYETMKELEKFMKPETLAWAKWQLEEFYPKYYYGVNDVFKSIYHTDMPQNKHYSPIKRQYAKGKEIRTF